MDTTYDLDARYFAIQTADGKIYYSTRTYLLIGKDPAIRVTARTSLTEGEYFAYSGNTGGRGTGVHLHLINYNEGDPTKSPLIDLYNANGQDAEGYNPPNNLKAPWITMPYFDSATNMISTDVSSIDLSGRGELDNNKFEIFAGGTKLHEVSFYPRKNAFDGDITIGNKTGIDVDPSDIGAKALKLYYKIPERTCSNGSMSSITIKATDAGGKEAYKTRPLDLVPPTNCPGGDHPDDSYDVSDILDLPPDEVYQGEPVWITPRVGLLKDGFVPEMGDLLNLKNIRYTFQPVDEISSSLR